MECNTKSLETMIEFIDAKCGGLETPSICVEPDGVMALSWWGERGNLVIAFTDNGIEYSYIGNNGEVDIGNLADNFDSLWKKAGIRFLVETSIFEKKKNRWEVKKG